MQVRVQAVDFFLTHHEPRALFKFGTETLRSASMLHTRARIETDAGPARGYSADLLVPRWFEKTPGQSPAEDVRRLRESARAAADVACALPAATAFDLWWALYRARTEGVPPEHPARLLVGFGVAAVERAVLDGLCRACDRTLFEALREDLFRFDPARVLPQLADLSARDVLPAAPREHVLLRHTVGGLDPLLPGDGPGRALVEEVERDGLRSFKIKLSGEVAQDAERLKQVARVLAPVADLGPVTVDGNEQFDDLGDLARVLADCAADEHGERLLAHLAYVEQPLPRDRTLTEAGNARLADVTAFAPLLIDEADVDVTAFPRALELGYRGVSAKSCKGVFRALLNRAVCARTPGAFQSGEDLTTLPTTGLQSDLTLMAALGMEHVERNGHHYFPGLGHLSPAEIEAATTRHAGLYRPSDAPGGWELRIERGELDLRSLQCPGMGFPVPHFPAPE